MPYIATLSSSCTNNLSFIFSIWPISPLYLLVVLIIFLSFFPMPYIATLSSSCTNNISVRFFPLAYIATLISSCTNNISVHFFPMPYIATLSSHHLPFSASTEPFTLFATSYFLSSFFLFSTSLRCLLLVDMHALKSSSLLMCNAECTIYVLYISVDIFIPIKTIRFMRRK